jgi:hypothetical protein
MLIINSSLVVPHNLIHKYKHALVNEGFKVFISKKHTHIYIFNNKYNFLKKTCKLIKYQKQKETQTEKKNQNQNKRHNKNEKNAKK